MSHVARLGVGLLVLASLPAQADVLAPADAIPPARLQQWLRDALPGVGTRLTVTEDAGRDRIFLTDPMIVPARAGQPAGIVALVRQRDARRWAIEDVRIPSPATVVLPASALAPMPAPSPPNPSPSQLVIAIGDQHVTGTIDTSFATRSVIDYAYKDIDIGLATSVQRQFQHIEGTTARMVLTPRPDGLLDVDNSGEVNAVALTAKLNDKATTTSTIDRAHGASHIGGLDRARLVSLIAAITRLQSARTAAPATAPSTPGSEQRPPGQPDAKAAAKAAVAKAGHEVLKDIRDIATDVSITDSIDGLKIKSGLQTTQLDHVGFGMALGAPGGILKLGFDLVLDGLRDTSASPMMAPYLPRHFALRPTLTGISGTDLIALGDLAIDTNSNPAIMAPAIAALFGHGGIKLDLDGFAWQAPTFKFTGNGTITVAQPTLSEVSGTGHVAAEGFDALLALARNNPAEQKTLAGLIYARGLARQEGGRLLWDIDYKSGTLIVNGTPVPLGVQAQAPPPER